MFRRFKKSAVFFTCPIPLAVMLLFGRADAQQLPAPTQDAPVVIGETPGLPQAVPTQRANALPEPYLLPQQDPQSDAPATASKQRPSLGVVAEERSDRAGLTVLSVRELSPAEQAGVRVGDILTGLNGRQATTIEDVSDALSPLRAGDPVAIEVSRDGKFFELRAAMSDAPPPVSDVVPVGPESEPGEMANGESRGVLGVRVEDAAAPRSGAPALRGARVVSVSAHSPAESIGIRPGDTIVSIDGQVMYGARELTNFMVTARAGQSVEIGYYQDRVLRRKRITLADSGQPMSADAEYGERDIAPGIVIRPGANVGEILQDVGRSIDSFLGPRRAPAMPQPAPLNSFAPRGPAAIPAPQSMAPKPQPTIPTPASKPEPAEEITQSDDASEVVRLRQQVQELLERMQQLEKQVEQAEQPKADADETEAP
ncbi:putative periplasmic serine endoprotease DegP-like precursor [Rosistilla ulvae]|uniref:Putative periplasmic serine endoprotease DegP-like n=1 Tax=Rosistilla ulvae TaxID=1930277 RepID=A0A517M359_9BACT|nr:PDZ domain-containing protein [Rosistilla ulvae]QDS89311.1 putative periplasmic serine endoprotease DegP-like precursor [Rosistilla ulvae]